MLARTYAAARRVAGRGLSAIGFVFALALVLAAPHSASAAGFTPYFGDLHSHTSDSNASGTPAQAFAAAAAAGASFQAVTDHTGWFGPEVWAAQRAAADAATTPSFVALNGFEVTMSWGHINVWGAGVMPTADELAAMESGGPTALYDWLLAHPGAIGQWNHPTHKSDEFRSFAGLTPERRAAMVAIEVGNESFRYEASYTNALDRGWAVMPAANSDTHGADWITGCPNRTVLLAPALTRAALLEALAARRGYATVDRDLRVSFCGNGAVMGGTLDRPASVRFDIRVKDPLPHAAGERLKWLAIVSDRGKVVALRRCTGFLAKWTPILRVRGAHYYFLRVKNTTGRVAWTAPIWTGRSFVSAP